MNIKPVVNNITQSSLNMINKTGAAAINAAHGLGSCIKNSSKTQDVFQGANGAKKIPISKETVVGGVVMAISAVLAFECIKGIKDSIKNLKKEAET